MGIKDGHEIKTRGILYGYTTLVWISLLLHSIGGLIVGLVIKYSDNILKGFAASSSVVLACIIAIVYFDFQLSILFSIGSSLVILSIIIYSNSEFISTIPIFKLVFKDKPIYI
jgi:UDP-sugar transporter A1/2/3